MSSETTDHAAAVNNTPPLPQTALLSRAERLNAVVEVLKNLRELILVVVFLCGGALWLVNYFATREELDKLTCATKVNVQMLQATAGANYSEQQLKQTQMEKREQERMLEVAKTSNDPNGKDTAIATSAENRIDELAQEERTLVANRVVQLKTAKNAFAALTEEACLDSTRRKTILDHIANGEF